MVERGHEKAMRLTAGQKDGHNLIDELSSQRVDAIRLDLDIDREGAARCECLVQSRNELGQVPPLDLTNDSTIAEYGIMVDDDLSIGSEVDIEFDPVGRLNHRTGERGDGVSGRKRR